MDLVKKYFIIISSILISLYSCSGSTENQSKNENVSRKESLEKVNRYLIRTEAEDIDNYIRRHGWKAEETGTGLHYWIYENGNGEQAKKGQIAVLNFQTFLINGNLIYSSDELGYKEFKIGKGGVETGLEEAILLMRVGDKAKLVIPSHLAFGLLGDNDKIPPRSTVVYDIELVSLK
ncbi:MAG TPA: FKBP-type peptidyl-prolyl cis-trans isomerase [Bacteroidales bacterium]